MNIEEGRKIVDTFNQEKANLLNKQRYILSMQDRLDHLNEAFKKEVDQKNLDEVLRFEKELRLMGFSYNQISQVTGTYRKAITSRLKEYYPELDFETMLKKEILLTSEIEDERKLLEYGFSDREISFLMGTSRKEIAKRRKYLHKIDRLNGLSPKEVEIEKQLISGGLTFHDIQELTGRDRHCISDRNVKYYKIDRVNAFQKHLETKGVPNRLSVTDDAAYNFWGLFMTEGTFDLSIGDRFYIGISISQSEDIATLKQIQTDLTVGLVMPKKRNKADDKKEEYEYKVYNVIDLQEVIIPLLEKYPLMFRKSKEYSLFKDLVYKKYIYTLGGKSGQAIPQTYQDDFIKAMDKLSAIQKTGKTKNKEYRGVKLG
ncbi:hypothetical protein EJF36_19100 [Bacillus sp. HMF5848]|uniref:LAGLIDADG family homing endonuclease n=1 Tax=Bacillus sp. HMF5848 TaxID=2495421 RepID=UPI000F7694F5|nr:LAGLIDADG family homing endonuclease [Bacillus sp. HMF5848]RSK28813.1 hypothetical protein EJF36_19100 [Bacillus sp. HMF5848]